MCFFVLGQKHFCEWAISKEIFFIFEDFDIFEFSSIFHYYLINNEYKGQLIWEIRLIVEGIE